MENVLLDRFKDQVRNLKTLSEELQVQMALGKAEARDLIESESKKLTKYINEQRTEMSKNTSSTSENRREFLTCIENLESSLNEAIPTKVRAYDKYKNKVLQNVYALEEEVRENYPKEGSKMQETLDTFKVKMDAFRVNLALHDKDDPEKVSRIRTEFTAKLTEVRQLLGEREQAQTKLDHFVEDIAESFSYLRRAINDLSN